MVAPSWHAIADGDVTDASDVNQMLGLHSMQIAYQGLPTAQNVGVASLLLPIYGQFLDQPFTNAGSTTSISRITLWAQAVGAGADTLVMLQTDSGGHPSGTSLAAMLLPADFVPAGGRWVSIPMPAIGLTANQVLHIVIQAAGSSDLNTLEFGAYGSTNPVNTSPDGSTWAAGTEQLLFQAIYGSSQGNVVNVSEDGGARWSEWLYDGQNNLIGYNEYVGSVRSTLSVSYDSLGHVVSLA